MRSSLVFLITVSIADPANKKQMVQENERLMQTPYDYANSEIADPEHMDSGTTPDLVRAVKSLVNANKEKEPQSNPVAPDYPGRMTAPQIVTEQQVEQENMRNVMIKKAQPVQAQ